MTVFFAIELTMPFLHPLVAVALIEAILDNFKPANAAERCA